MKKKRKIFYARYYRHLKVDLWKVFVFTLLFTAPILLICFIFMDDASRFVCNLGIKILADIFPGLPFNIDVTDFSIISKLYYIDLPVFYPSKYQIYGNIVVSVLIMLISMKKIWKGSPLTIYFFLNGTIHLVNSLYFLFATYDFPVKAVTYSKLYMQQEAGIITIFLLLMGLCTAFVGNRNYLAKIMASLAVLIYSIVFGMTRYILFLYILTKYSILYVSLMYFTIGPILDFVYFVMIYAAFINHMIKIFDSTQERDLWEWS
ncbi:MAG: hypothetical protein K6B41_05275 [Butyrivibrio sp.]|nr:hypothetical protein [Butyrivibrio sp.]